ncbi:hypothetical protein [Limnobacter sp.]|jgi:hypothetical protein|uniref:hypothetical protein n=1 Tax=Limnobacter sp. TaxID=2003368 RepID=UPI00311E5002
MTVEAMFGSSLNSSATGFGSIGKPSSADIQSFSNFMTGDRSEAVIGFVEKSEQRLGIALEKMSKRVDATDSFSQVRQLFSMAHESSMASVYVQMVGKAASKGTESFETLIKQQ